MNSNHLSKLYFYSVEEIHQITTELYEDLHTDSGDPIKNWETVMDLLVEYKKGIAAEVEGIKSAIEEYNESKVKL